MVTTRVPAASRSLFPVAQPALEFDGDDALVVNAGRLVRSQPHDRRPHNSGFDEPPALGHGAARKPSAGTSQNPCGCVMKRGLTVRIPSPALLTSMSMPPSRDHAWPTARATEDSSRTSRPMPAAPGSSAATAAARAADRPVSATVAPAAARAEAIARPSPLVPPVTSTFSVEELMTARLGGHRARAERAMDPLAGYQRSGRPRAQPGILVLKDMSRSRIVCPRRNV